jgi:H+/Cl- antiporter ClcA/predicted transcriptional regulator
MSSDLRDRLLASGQSSADSDEASSPLQPLSAPRAPPPMQPLQLAPLTRAPSSSALARVPSSGMLLPLGAQLASSPTRGLDLALESNVTDHAIAVMSNGAHPHGGGGHHDGGGCAEPHPDSTEQLESLDYDTVVNTVYMSWLESTYAPARRRLLGYSGRTFARWLLCWILGVAIGAFAFVVSTAVGWIEQARTAMFDGLFDALGRGRGGFAVVSIIFVCTNLALALGAALLVVRVSPQAAGSGLPAVRAYLNGVHIPRVLSAACLVVKVLGSVMAVGSLLCIGPEGPLVHIGAIVGSGLTRGRKHTRVGWPLARRGETRPLSISWPWVGQFRNDVDRREFISIGAAAGFSAAFGSPIGGVLYCLEECSSHWSQQLIWRAMTSTTVSSITLMLLRSWRDATAPSVTNLGLLSLESLSVGPLVSGRRMSSLVELLLYAALGAAGGLLGAVWCRAFAWLGERRPRSARGKLIELGVISVTTSILLFALPLMLAVCVPANKALWSEGGFGEQFACADGEVDELGSLLLTSREMAIKQLISKPENFHTRSLLVTAAIFFPALAFTFGAATPAGSFMPLILIGCALGGVVGQLLRERLGGDTVTEGTFALMGAVAMLGGVMRSSISLCVIILEGTGQVQLLVPIIVTTVAARYVGNMFSEGVVELAVELHRPRIPMVVMPSNNRLARYRASEIMSSPVVALDRRARVRTVISVLAACRHNGFPVVDPNGLLVGTVLRSQLLAVLHNPHTIVAPVGDAPADAPPQGLAPVREGSADALPRTATGQLASASDCGTPACGGSRAASEGAPAEIAELFAPPATVCMTSTRWTLRRPSTTVRLESSVVLDRHAWDEEDYIDLSDEMNIGPLIVLPNTPASRVFALFSSMGLRHLPVVSAGGGVVGMITRHDLYRFQRLIDSRHADRSDHFGHDGLQRAA